MSFAYWQFFIAIESDLERTARYVEPHIDNYQTYSVAFAQLILSACSEIDVVSKLLCSQIDPNSAPENINHYREIIHSHYPGFHDLEVLVPRYGLSIVPWNQWQTGNNPDWWRSYNKVKHERHNHFSLANLHNALHSVAGLFVAVLYLYPKELRADTLQPWPSLLTLNPNWNSRIRSNLRPGFILPDFAT